MVKCLQGFHRLKMAAANPIEAIIFGQRYIVERG